MREEKSEEKKGVKIKEDKQEWKRKDKGKKKKRQEKKGSSDDKRLKKQVTAKSQIEEKYKQFKNGTTRCFSLQNRKK